METEKMLASTFEELKAEEEENDRLTKEIEQLKRYRKIADNFMSGYRRYTWSKQKEIEDLKRELRNEQLFHNRQLKKVIDLEKQIEQRKGGKDEIRICM